MAHEEPLRANPGDVEGQIPSSSFGRRAKGFRFRFLALLVPTALAVWGGLFYTSLRQSEATILETLHRQGFEHGMTQSREFQVLLESCRRSAKGLSLALEQVDRLQEAEIQHLQARILQENAHVFGTAVALVPGATRRGYFAPYAHRDPTGRVVHTQLVDETYHYPAWGWFRDPLEANSGIWSDPYYDQGGGDILMTTYSTPIWSKGRAIGVATVDVSMDYLNRRLERLARGQGSLAFVLTEDQRIIGPRAFGMRSGNTLQEQGMDAQGFLPGLADLIQRPSGRLARLPHPYSGRPAWVLAIPISLTENTQQVWTLVAVFPEDEMLRDLTRLRIRALALVAMGLILLAGALAWLLYGLARPIEHLVDQAERYSAGNYSDTLDEWHGFREIRRLSAAFNHMGRSILEQFEAVRASTLRQDKYHRELQFASEVQGRILPQNYPPFPDLMDQMDLFGLSRPAREMGGDFFDFIRLGPDRVALVIADVSDKGAGSALFAAMTRMLLRELLAQGLLPEEAMRRANLQLQRQNPHDMFVTTLLVEYSPGCGEGHLVCAGHDAPLARGANGEVRTLMVGRAMPLAALEGTRYQALPFRLAPGEALLCFTDGITEATSETGDFFGMHRLEKALSDEESLAARPLAERILASVVAFQGGAEQADDITMVVLKRLPGAEVGAPLPDPPRRFRLELEPRTSSLPVLAAFAEAVAQEAGLDERRRHHVHLALEEIAMNLVMHGGPRAGTFQVRADLEPERLLLEVLDSASPFPFDAASTAYPGVPDPEGPVGGVGLYLVRRLMDEVQYEPGTPEGNRMRLVMHLRPGL